MSRFLSVPAALVLALGVLPIQGHAAAGQADPVVTPDPTPPPVGIPAPSGTVTVTSSPAQEAPARPRPRAHALAAGLPSKSPPPAPTPVRALAEAAEDADPAPPPGPRVIERAELCLRAEVASAVRAESSAKLAVDLLLEDLCGADVEAASRYERNLMALSRFNPVSERGRAGLSTARVDEETGEILNPPGVDVASAVRDVNPELASQRPSASLRLFAARLVLAGQQRVTPPPRRTR